MTSQESDPRVVVIIPTYNEREALPGTLDRLRRSVPGADVLVVDDASPDGTGEWAEQLGERDAQVHVLHRTSKDGLGRAYIAGFGWALEHGYDLVVEMDADASHRPEELPRLLEAARDERVALVIGSRRVRGGGTVNWPWYRQLISRAGTAYPRLVLRLPVKDATAGFRAYPAWVLRTLPLDEVESHGYAFQVDMTYRVHRMGGRIVEVPITFVERVEGVSKMTGSIVREAFVNVTRWGMQDAWRRMRRQASDGQSLAR
ncbi:dolichol-phosphate mannosyltransferase [Salana multivorans]|uniref:Dolichol-phosphate mannosyltransferase n=1 Tax=Salana multivorans TaxID=120377 RepID=A0A3N2D188_9MICO|nr:polyprenol monophosphomannose synthase [Salana multivorans]OJX94328.1 MAG: dolichol-phosphate mannosyltransferase [Micrococcales bacterium 73-15]ROR93550.1 dolichol-phosphate mannosyltransferase [Salana multivorans]